MSSPNPLVSRSSSKIVAVEEVVYRRKVYLSEANCGGGNCPPRRSKSDLSVSSPSFVPCSPNSSQATLQLTNSPCVRRSPGNRSVVVPPHNTPCVSPYESPRVGPVNVTSNSSQMSLMVPQIVNRSRSVGALDEVGVVSSTMVNPRRSRGPSFFAGNGSISRILNK